MEKVCKCCGNKNFKDAKVEYTFKYDDHLLQVEDVPCEQCEFCGEKYFQADILKKIEKEFYEIFLTGERPFLKIKVPIKTFSDISKTSK